MAAKKRKRRRPRSRAALERELEELRRSITQKLPGYEPAAAPRTLRVLNKYDAL